MSGAPGLIVVGASHQTAPVEVRERMAIPAGEVPVVLSGLIAAGRATEAVALSTCNRTELYAAAADRVGAERALREVIGARFVDGSAECARFLYVRRDRQAIEHLLRVSSGLDSMVLGEPQIQGQVRDAYAAAAEVGAAGAALNRAFQQALRIGGRVRSETDLGAGAASISTAAVELAKKIFGSLAGRRALVLGAGEMSESTIERLRGEGVRSTLVANRTHARATELAARWEGRAVRWEAMPAALREVDIVICSTAAPHPVLTRERVREALPGGAPRPLCIIDIAVPRDVDPRVGQEPNVFLYDLDDLEQIVDGNLDRRRGESPAAEAIIAEGVEEYWSWYTGLAVVPTIRDLRARGEAVRRREVERALRRLEHLDADDREAVDHLTRSILNKLLHAPTVRLREAAGNGRGTGVLDFVRYLFELDAVADGQTAAESDDSTIATAEPDRS